MLFKEKYEQSLIRSNSNNVRLGKVKRKSKHLTDFDFSQHVQIKLIE